MDGHEVNTAADKQKRKVFCQTEDEAPETSSSLLPPPPSPPSPPTTYSPASLITLEGCKFYSGGGVGRVRLLCQNPQAGLSAELGDKTARLAARRIHCCPVYSNSVHYSPDSNSAQVFNSVPFDYWLHMNGADFNTFYPISNQTF